MRLLPVNSSLGLREKKGDVPEMLKCYEHGLPVTIVYREGMILINKKRRKGYEEAVICFTCDATCFG